MDVLFIYLIILVIEHINIDIVFYSLVIEHINIDILFYSLHYTSMLLSLRADIFSIYTALCIYYKNTMLS